MKDLTRDQLESQLTEWCRERLETKMKAASDKTVSHLSSKLRRNIARVKTELRARELGLSGNAQPS
jgi:ribosomal protein L29